MALTKSAIFAQFAKFVKIVNFAKNWKICLNSKQAVVSLFKYGF